MKDYYAILGIERTAGPEAVKKAYRQKALLHHPDRNRNDPTASERFKDVAEAYGVLMDPVKRREYDRCRADGGGSQKAPHEDFRYSQEDIFRDMFNNPGAGSSFEELFKEFEKTGLRFDRQFFQKTLFGGRGIFIGGIFLFGFLNMPGLAGAGLVSRLAGRALRGLLSMGALKMLGSTVGQLLGSQRRGDLPEQTASQKGGAPLARVYDLAISHEKAEQGAWVKIALPGSAGNEKIKVRIPAGIRSGQRLRLQGKGREQDGRRGDLSIAIRVLEE